MAAPNPTAELDDLLSELRRIHRSGEEKPAGSVPQAATGVKYVGDLHWRDVHTDEVVARRFKGNLSSMMNALKVQKAIAFKPDRLMIAQPGTDTGPDNHDNEVILMLHPSQRVLTAGTAAAKGNQDARKALFEENRRKEVEALKEKMLKSVLDGARPVMGPRGGQKAKLIGPDGKVAGGDASEDEEVEEVEETDSSSEEKQNSPAETDDDDTPAPPPPPPADDGDEDSDDTSDDDDDAPAPPPPPADDDDDDDEMPPPPPPPQE